MEFNSTPFTYSSSYSLIVSCLKWVGFHRNDKTNKNFHFTKPLTGLCFCSMALLVFTWSAYESMQRNLISEATPLFGGVIIIQIYLVMIIVYWWKSDQLVRLFIEMEALTNDMFQDTPAIKETAKSCVDLTIRLSKLWIITLHVIMTSYPLAWTAMTVRNLTRGFYSSSFLMIKLLLPGDRQTLAPYNELLNVIMIVAIFIIGKGYSGWNGLIFSQMIFVKYQFDAIGAKIMDLFVDLDLDNCEETLMRRLDKVVRWHQKVIEFATLMRCTFSLYVAVIQVYIGLVMCICVLTIFNIIKSGNGEVLAILILPGTLVLIFALCKLGHEIGHSSLKISEAVYKCNWECYPSVRVRRTLMIIMLRSQTPVQMTAANIFVLNLPTFATIIKSAYTYYTFLQTI